MSAVNSTVLQAVKDDFKKRRVWTKGTPIPGYDPEMWRYDPFFWIIKWTDHGDRSSTYGWEMDHYPVPVVLGEPDDIDNLRPVHYANTAGLGGGLGASRSALAAIGRGRIGGK